MKDQMENEERKEEPELPVENSGVTVESEETEPVENEREDCGTEAETRSADIERLIAEAEARGRLQALNEMAERKMGEPVMFEDLARRRSAQREEPAPEGRANGFLSNIRPSVWD